MENKYYVPQIEEFHVGFECEYNNVKSNKWIPHTIQFDPTNDIFRNFFLTNEIRVKYLDRDDIQEYGWELDSVVKKEGFFIHKNSNFNNGEIRLVFREIENTVEIMCDKSNFSFYGIIKNKSEFKKLMIQLNIK